MSRKLLIIGSLLPSLCLADAQANQTAASGNGSTLTTSAADYFGNNNSESPQNAVTVTGAPLRIWIDQKRIWTSPFHLQTHDLEWMIPLGAATGLLIATDHHTTTLIRGDPHNQSQSSSISNGGVALFAGASAISYSIGTFGSEHARETGLLTTEALTDSFLFTEGLKFLSQRTRPYTNSARGAFWQGTSLNSSFPSQHAALAWSAATVFAREYPGPVTQWAAYGLASLVSMSRLTANQHFPSDILIGAASGYLIGRYVYHAHHDDRMVSRTESTSTAMGKTVNSSAIETAHGKPPTASVYIPLDSWIYPVLRRLADLGYIPDQVSGQAPWTRAECLRQLAQATALASGNASGESNHAANDEALRLISDLRSALDPESETDNMIRLESVYTRFTDIAGTPLRDSYHFGQTIANDFGRPYDRGLNNVTGFSSYALSGRFSAYFRGEYQSAPSRAAGPLAVRQYISGVDGIPISGPQNIAATSRFQPLDMYMGVQLGFENIAFGKQSLWWGPGEESVFTFSNNAAPFYMLRMTQTQPLILPGPFRLLGKIRTDVLFGKLSGHRWPARPFINAQKISLGLTDNFEIGFTRAAIFGGVGHPLTLGGLKASLFSVNSVDLGPYGSPDLPGTRFSSFDFRWRIPGVRKYVTVYSDSYGRDEPNPIDNPKRAPWAPGLYLTRLPGLPRLDFRFETYSTWLYRKDQGGNFTYWDNQYRDANTNNGVLFGSWIGRDSRAYTAEARYWLSAKSKITGNYRQIKAADKFLPGGGTQTDVAIAAQWGIRSEWMVSVQVQGERYYIPVLGAPRYDALTSIGITYNPSYLALHK